MAYNDFMMGSLGFGPQAFETEEERRKRLEQEANAEVQTQTVKTYADGTQEAITKTQISAPVSPDQVFNRQLQVESGGQHYAPSGQILTSPKGAVGVAQVMPSTAANPGFGIKPITPEELASPEGNQAFGLRYKQGMLNAFGGDEEKATAAYNAGPGRIQQAVQTADKQGGSWKDYIPQETQNYLQKVLGGALNAVVPSAQAAEVPTAPAATTTAPGQFVNLGSSAGPTVSYQAPKAEPTAPVAPGQEQFNVPPAQAQMGPPPSAAPGFADRFVQAQKDPAKLAAIAVDETETPAIRSLARDMYYQQETARREIDAVKERTRQALETGNANQLTRDLRNPEGSMLKYWFFKSAGWDEAAKQEADKLGFSDVWQQISLPGGGQAAVRFGADGTAKSGIDVKGNTLTPAQLDTLHGGGGAVMKGAVTHTGKMQDITTGEVYYERTTPQGIQLVDNNGKVYRGASNNLRPFGIGSDIATKNQIQINELTNKLAFVGPTERAKIVAENEAKYGPLDPTVRAQALGGQLMPVVTGTVPTATPPSATAPTAVTPTTPVAPATTTTAPVPSVATAPTTPPPAVTTPAAKPLTIAERDIQAKGSEKETIQLAEDRAKIRANYGQIKENVDVIENLGRELVTHPGFEVSVGATVQPGFQYIPGTDKADWYARFKEVQGKQFISAIDSLRGTGAISDKEGDAAKAAVSRMSTSQSEQEFRKAQHEFVSMMKRYADRASEKIGEPKLYNEPSMSQQTKDNAEAKRWLKQNPRDPRAVDIRAKLRDRGEL
jgi:hypothetical protein